MDINKTNTVKRPVSQSSTSTSNTPNTSKEKKEKPEQNKRKKKKSYKDGIKLTQTFQNRPKMKKHPALLP